MLFHISHIAHLDLARIITCKIQSCHFIPHIPHGTCYSVTPCPISLLPFYSLESRCVCIGLLHHVGLICSFETIRFNVLLFKTLGFICYLDNTL